MMKPASFLLSAIALAACGSPLGPTISGKVMSVSAGLVHTCAVTTDGVAYCWGANSSGELGIGAADLVLHAAPVAVSGGLRFASLSVGGDHACGVTSAGAAYCWGGNGYGGLGDGTTTTRPSPTAVAGGLTFVGVSAAGQYLEGDLNGGHSCGVTVARAAYCWGLAPGLASPAAVAGGLAFAAVSTFDDIGGSYHVCGITPVGAGYCWGADYFGQLGDGALNFATSPVPVRGFTFAVISAGGEHTCGVTTDGVAYCWGSNSFGQLGNGAPDFSSHSVPAAVTGGLFFVTVSTGGFHTCGITTGGTTYCWGSNSSGQLGIGVVDLTPHPTPALVAGGLVFAAISAGVSHTCGVTTGGTAYCWGSNTSGQLGNGSTVSSSRPTAVAGQ